LGSTLFANVVGHFGINYMAHLSMYLFVLLVCISTAANEGLRSLYAEHRMSEVLDPELVPTLPAEVAAVSVSGPTQTIGSRLFQW
jgi:hypothetical protein